MSKSFVSTMRKQRESLITYILLLSFSPIFHCKYILKHLSKSIRLLKWNGGSNNYNFNLLQSILEYIWSKIIWVLYYSIHRIHMIQNYMSIILLIHLHKKLYYHFAIKGCIWKIGTFHTWKHYAYLYYFFSHLS